MRFKVEHAPTEGFPGIRRHWIYVPMWVAITTGVHSRECEASLVDSFSGKCRTFVWTEDAVFEAIKFMESPNEK